MPEDASGLNLIAGWSLVVCGIAFGAVLGLWFHQDDWLGGYASLRRRLYRLGHIAFFGLAIINLLFYLTVRVAPLTGPLLPLASWGFALGGLAMPLCCLIMAHRPGLRMLFSVPIALLLAAALITLWEVLRP